MILQRLEKRPVSPHVFEIDNPTKFHYDMPINAISSIANRVTGVMLSVGRPLKCLGRPHAVAEFPCCYGIPRLGSAWWRCSAQQAWSQVGNLPHEALSLALLLQG